MLKISFDIATRSTGVVVLKGSELVLFKCIKTPKFKVSKEWFTELDNQLREINSILGKRFGDNYKCNLIYELANHSNPGHTQKFSTIAGYIISFLFYHVENIKTSNANGWFKFFNQENIKVRDWTHIPRQTRKELSIEKFEDWLLDTENKKHYDHYQNFTFDEQSDISDAYWLANYYEKI